MSLRAHRVIVVGGGISGLAAAYYLLRTANGRPVEVTVLEASGRTGGKLASVEVGDLRLEAGADSFVVRKPFAVELAQELGLEDRLVLPGASGAFVWARGRLVRFPEHAAFGVPVSLRELLGWEGLSVRGRLRAALEPYRWPRHRQGDEALGALARRRLGREAAAVLVEPLLAGLHAADPMRLSVRATFPELQAWEIASDSLTRGARKALEAAAKDPDPRKPMFATVWGGLDALVEALASAVGPARIRTDAPVERLERAGEGFRVHASGQTVETDAVVLAAPAFESARLLAEANPAAAAELGGISYASTAAVCLVYPPGTGERLPQGTGFVVPQGERTVTACTWLSRKWPREDFGDRAVVRCFVGWAGDERALDLDDDELIDRVAAEVELATPLGAQPEASRVVRWTMAMPQYEVGHLDRLERIRTALRATPGLSVTGSGYGGVGIADCVRQAREAAEAVRTAWSRPSSDDVREEAGKR